MYTNCEDLYKILGVSVDANDDEIKKAYRQKARNFHPDKGGDQEEFIYIQIAYEVLSDKKKRAEYDRTGFYSVEENRLYDKIVETLIKFFMEEVEKHLHKSDFLCSDYIELVRVRCRKQKGETVQGKYVSNKEIEKFEQLRKRLKFRGKNRNVLDDSILYKIKQLKQRVFDCKNNIEVIEGVLNMLKVYSFEQLMQIMEENIKEENELLEISDGKDKPTNSSARKLNNDT